MPGPVMENDAVGAAFHENGSHPSSPAHARKMRSENVVKTPHKSGSSERTCSSDVSRPQVREENCRSPRKNELNGMSSPERRIQVASSSPEYCRDESGMKSRRIGVDEGRRWAEPNKNARAASRSPSDSPKRQSALDDGTAADNPTPEATSFSNLDHEPQQSRLVQKSKQPMQNAGKRSVAQSPDRASSRKDLGSPARQLRGSSGQPRATPQLNVPRNVQGRLHSKRTADDSSPSSDSKAMEERTPQKFERRSIERPSRSSSDKVKKSRSRVAYHRRSDSNESGTIGSDQLPMTDEDVLSNPGSLDLGPLLLKLASALHLSGENPLKALECASRAAKFLERAAGGKASLELVMSLHILAAIYCRLGQFEEAIPVLQRAVVIPDIEEGVEHALAAFAGHMQLGDILALLGHHASALSSYHTAYEIQKMALGEMDPQVGETCSYLAEAHVQALQFQEAEELCLQALKIHTEHSPPGSLEEAADRRLMALILSGKGEHELALEHLVLANAALTAKGKDADVAAVDSSIGDMYVALGRYDEAAFSYQKSLSCFKSANGDSHTSVASVYVSLAEMNMKTGKQREAKSFCENALRIYGRQNAGHSLDDLASGLTEIASVYESMNEREQALCLLQRALDILEELPGQQSAVAGVEAQMGVLYYALGKFEEAFMALKSAVSKLRSGAESKSAMLGIVLNQLGLACVGLNEIWHAADTFEEAKNILEDTCGAHHPDTLAVCSNLAGAYDALGRSDDAISLLEEILEVKEERLGTVHPDVEEERQRLMELLNEAGRARVRKTNTLEELLLLSNVEVSKYQANGSHPH